MFGSYENNFCELLEYEVFCAFQFLDALQKDNHLFSFLNLNITWKVLLG